jgi:hypothetical protein
VGLIEYIPPTRGENIGPAEHIEKLYHLEVSRFDMAALATISGNSSFW